MTPTILPEIVRCNLGPMRHALDAYEAGELTPEQAEEFFFLCSFLADAIEKSWATIQAAVRKGIEGRKLSALLQEVSSEIETTLQTCERFQHRISAGSAWSGTADKPSRLAADVERVKQVRHQVVALLDWLKAPSPPLDLEKLKSLESGPFVRVGDSQAHQG